MTDGRGVAALARVLADESRATMCLAMLDGSAWTLTELARAARVSLPTASEHVSKMVDAEIATEERLGRNRYVRLAGQEVADAFEAFTALASAPAPATSLRGVSERRRLAAARTCYDHLAGRLGVAVLDAMVARDLVRVSAGIALTGSGEHWFTDLDVDLDDLRARRRPLARECLDWTERRPHLAGSLGAALCERFLAKQWVRRPDRSRRLEVTGRGEQALRAQLGVQASALRV
ncbi:MAG TPA: helix-turn-helix domain-containing protein [Nocardioidaceae bacterium]|nr:helix-turn-helix domain-containing protein [Nocardioidaceae bacterium]